MHQLEHFSLNHLISPLCDSLNVTYPIIVYSLFSFLYASDTFLPITTYHYHRRSSLSMREQRDGPKVVKSRQGEPIPGPREDFATVWHRPDASCDYTTSFSSRNLLSYPLPLTYTRHSIFIINHSRACSYDAYDSYGIIIFVFFLFVFSFLFFYFEKIIKENKEHDTRRFVHLDDVFFLRLKSDLICYSF